MRLAVGIRSRDPRRVDEALRAALGLTLRGDRVAVVFLEGAAAPRGSRALATLRALGHDVDAPVDALADADVVEVWS